MPAPLRQATIAVLLAFAAGCGISLSPPSTPKADAAAALPSAGEIDAGPFGAIGSSQLLAPFTGEWALDWDKTVAARKAAGATPEAIEQMQKLRQIPQLAELGSKLTITGDVAIGDPFPFSEYRFFSMHPHGEYVCGKAWHHEDRHDPGDMSKCYVRLQLVDGILHMQVRMLEGLPDNDPDLLSTPPAEGGSAEECDAEDPAPVRGIGNEPNEWTEWMTNVFTRQP